MRGRAQSLPGTGRIAASPARTVSRDSPRARLAAVAASAFMTLCPPGERELDRRLAGGGPERDARAVLPRHEARTDVGGLFKTEADDPTDAELVRPEPREPVVGVHDAEAVRGKGLEQLALGPGHPPPRPRIPRGAPARTG